MDLNGLNVPSEQELNQDWTPKKDSYSLILPMLSFTTALSGFCLLTLVAGHLQNRWPGSPFFLLVRIAGAIIVFLLSAVVGILRWFLTGNGTLFCNTPICFHKEAFPVYWPLVAGVIGSIFVWRVIRKTHLEKNTALVLISISAAITLLCFSIQENNLFREWLFEVEVLISRLWG